MPVRLSLWTLAFACFAGGLQAQGASAKDVLAAILLPKTAADVRAEGVPAKDVSTILDLLRNKAVPPTDAQTVLLAQRDVARNHGPVGNFGAVVQSKLDQGLRGRELADAIRAEHGLPPKVEKPKGDEKKVEKPKGNDKKAEKPKGKNKKAVAKPKPEAKPKPKPAAKGKPATEPPQNPMGH